MHVVMDIDTFGDDAVLVCERKVQWNTQVCLFKSTLNLGQSRC